MYSETENVRNKIRASVAIVVCLAVLGAFVVVLGGYRFWEKLDVYSIRFKSVKDLSVGQPVKYGGLDVGRILFIGVDPENPRMILVKVGLNHTVTLHQGVVARIAQKGLVGDYYVFLDPQNAGEKPLPPGSFIPSVETLDLSQLAGMVGEVLMELRPKLLSIASSLEQMFTSENSARITELLAKAPGLVEDLQKTSNEFRNDFAALTKDGRGALERLSKTLDATRQTVDTIRVEVGQTLVSMKSDLKQVGALTDTVHKSVRFDQEQLEDILENLDRLSSDLKYLSARLRERPWELINPPREHGK